MEFNFSTTYGGLHLVGAELAWHPRLAALFRHLNVFDSFTWLGEFGSSRTATPKPIRLWSNSNFIHGLRRTGFSDFGIQ